MEHFPVTLQGPHGGFALLSRKPPRCSVVFVHGFDGNPRSTWVDFPQMIEADKYRAAWDICDLFFYGYRSRDQIIPLAQRFAEFLKAVAGRNEAVNIRSEFALPSGTKRPAPGPTEILKQRGAAPYSAMILVGHSTGAVIIRQTILDSLTSAKQPTVSGATPPFSAQVFGLISNAELRFFAPAHLGVLAAGRLGFALKIPIIGWFLDLYLRTNPLYQSLRPGTPTLVDLKRDTEEIYKRDAVPACRAILLFGQHEDIVFVGKYSDDLLLPVEADQGHVSVCKPKLDYDSPLRFVIDGFSTARSA